MSFKKSKQKTPLSSVNLAHRPELFTQKILEPALFCNSALTKLKTKINILDFWVLVRPPEIDPRRKIKNKFGRFLWVVFFFLFLKPCPFRQPVKTPNGSEH